ncbi:TPA: hypothetical protein NJ626_000261 [Vibrio parahaemolyticus]|nr:hypothetical protein [Vibrio parahaemolyticus]HCM1516434.1 hypothetical protein [Vibrio parahaemolyticus]
MSLEKVLKSILPVLIIPILSWVMSTYSFTEIMRERMNTASEERSVINTKLDKVVGVQADQELRIRLLEDDTGEMQVRVDKIEKKVFNRE